ncbi:transketolase [Sulfitobacter sp. S223]|uniref:transketolase n=1 Tax=Sulfitobacter sp. S223 TaxID=2867023 RepID=UPI0021A69E2A|nr:transketolase [Sulfitobacter sp. S223]UWR25041.1 transketolase [Sulfitobacter sp. S223]
MRHMPLALATLLACATTPALATSVSLPTSALSVVTLPTLQDDQIVEIKNDKDKGQKAAKKNKPKKAKNNKKADKGNKQKAKQVNKSQKPDKNKSDKNNSDKIEAKVKRSKEDRARISDEVLQVIAPRGRDMTALLGAAPLALLGSQINFFDVSDEQLLTYRNCPPGLAKKDPPCVPPGLAKQGVTYDEWVGYDDDRLDRIYLEQRDQYLGANVPLYDNLLLSSDQIASLYGLRPAPSGNRYALIDGQPVLLTDKDYTSLLRINDLARVENLPAGLRVAPTAALTQRELRQAYKLPELEPGYNYAVVNGELVTLHDSAFETLQLIRIARAIF